MRSDWFIPICSGKERIRKKNNQRAHPTQKPESLLYRIILASSKIGDIVLDPFVGSGTTTVVAKKLQRNFIGIDNNKNYIKIARKRVAETKTLANKVVTISKSRKELPKIPFGELVEQGIIPPGATLTDEKNKFTAKVKIDGSISSKNISGSIHQVGAKIQELHSCNGWDFWHFQDNKKSVLLDKVREIYRNKKTF
jgi:modification methylase